MQMARLYCPLIGRVLLALIFVHSGFGKIAGFSKVAAGMAAKGVPFAELALVVSIVVEILGGIMLVFGCKARWGALALFLSLVPVTLLSHNFCALALAQYHNQFNHFMKNLGLMGAMLLVMAFGAGPFSVDERRHR